jgi:hypothetical protein
VNEIGSQHTDYVLHLHASSEVRLYIKWVH